MEQKSSNNNQFELLKRDYTPNIEDEIEKLDEIIGRVRKSFEKIEVLVEKGDYRFGIIN